MADVTRPGMAPGPMGADGRSTEPAQGGGAEPGSLEPVGERLIDPRAVRVAVGPATSDGGQAIVVAPLPEPLAPSSSTFAGRGVLGGAGMPPDDPAHAAPSTTAPNDAGPMGEGVMGEGSTGDRATVLVDGEPTALRLERRGRGRARLVIAQGRDNASRGVVFTEAPELGADGLTRREVVVDGWRIEVEIEPERRAVLRERARRGREAQTHGGATEIRAIIPGRIVSVAVGVDEAITAGQQILIVEAMKMQNELRAPRDGVVRRIEVAPGRTIEVGDLLLVLE